MLRTRNMNVSPLFGKKHKLCYQFPDPTSFLIFDLQIRGFYVICQPTESIPRFSVCERLERDIRNRPATNS